MSSFFLVLLRNIWIARNNQIFNNKPFQSSLIIRTSLAESIEYVYLSSPKSTAPSSYTSYISWVNPTPPFFKLNCDGSAKDNLLGAGGIIRDHTGN